MQHQEKLDLNYYSLVLPTSTYTVATLPYKIDVVAKTQEIELKRIE